MAFSERIKLVIDVATSGTGLGKLKTDLAAADGAFGKTKVAAGGLFDYLKKNAVLGVAAAGAAITGFAAKAIGDFQDTALGAGKLSDALGVTTEEASGLQEVAGDVGIGIGALESTIGRMNRVAASTPAAFDAIGASIVRNADGTTNVTETFLSVIDALDSIPDASQRAEAAQQIFGRSWQSIAELVASGADDVSAAIAGIETSKIIDEGEVEQARRFRDSLDDLQGVLESVTIWIGSKLVPFTLDFANGVAKVADGIESIGRGAKRIGAVLNPIDDIQNAFRALNPEVKGSVGVIEDASTAMEGLGPPTLAAIQAMARIDAAFEQAGRSAFVAMEQINGVGIPLVQGPYAPTLEGLKSLAAAYEAAGARTEIFNGVLRVNGVVVKDLTGLIKSEADALGEVIDAANASADAHTAEADAILATTSARRAAADAQFAFNDAQRALADDIAAVGTAISESGGYSVETAAALDQVAQSAGGVADSAVRVATEQAAANGSFLSATAAGDVFRASLVASAATAEGPARDAILAYAASVEAIPPEKVSEIRAALEAGDIDLANRLLNEASETREAEILATANTVAAAAALDGVKVDRIAQIIAEAQTAAADAGLTGVAAQQRVADIVALALTDSANSDLGLTARQRESIVQAIALTGSAESALNNLARNRTSTVTIRTVGGGTETSFTDQFGITRRHSGGPVAKGVPYIVGDHSAEELFVPETSGTVISAPDTRKMLKQGTTPRTPVLLGGDTVAGGGVTVNVNAPVFGVDHLRAVIAEGVRTMLRDRDRRVAAGARF